MKKNKDSLSSKKVAIIGAGASGLSCGDLLSERGIKVDIYEKSNQIGGLATSSKLTKGSIDTFYHHLFETDKYILDFIKKNRLNQKIYFKKAITGHIWDDKYFDISNIKKLYFSGLLNNYSFLRVLIGGALIKYLPAFFNLENKCLYLILDNLFGKDASNKIWKPLLVSKFGKHSKVIPYSWLKARIKDRSIKLGYAKGGFIEIYKFLCKKIKKSKGNIFINYEVNKIIRDGNSRSLIINNKKYDKIVVTTSPNINKKLLKELDYSCSKIEYLGALCGIIEFSKRPVPSYWIGITPDKKSKKDYNNFLALISYAELDEEWNKQGNPTWPVYVAAYLTKKEFFQYSQNEWKEKIINAIHEISYMTLKDKAVNKSDILNVQFSYADYAQPIISPSYNLLPNPESANLTYFANMHNIYPNDRGQNRAFYRGEEVAKEIINDFIKEHKYLK